ncbi:MAG: NAD-binding protein [Solirubrobacteraceae bacterium]
MSAEPEVLEPGRPKWWFGWLRGRTDRMWPLPIPVWWYVAVSIPLSIGLGVWGFMRLRTSVSQNFHYGFLESLYHAVKAYTLDIGPAVGWYGTPHANWQLWVALLLAALLVMRGLVWLLRGHLQRWVMRYRLGRHVIVCGAGVHGAQLADELARRHDVVLVDLDSGSLGMRAPLGKYEWRLIGDAVRAETLVAAGARRAHWVVAVTGDDFVNSQIVSAMRTLADGAHVRPGAHVLVVVEDAVLSRFLEERQSAKAYAGRLFVSPFSANAIAAESLIENADDANAAHLLLAGDHGLIDSLMLALLRRGRSRRLQDLETSGAIDRPPIHVSVLGPGAVERVERFTKSYEPEAEVLTLANKDAVRGEAAEEVEEWLAQRVRGDRAIVVCEEELDGIALSLQVSRALGPEGRITRVTTQLASVLDEHMREHTSRSPHLAATEARSIADPVAEIENLKGVIGSARLLAALSSREGDRDDVDLRALVDGLYKRDELLRIRTDHGWRILPCERPMIEEIAKPVPLSALIWAGLRFELGEVESLARAADGLSRAAREDPERSHDSVLAWCELARHVSSLGQLDDLHGKLGALERDPIGARILLLRRAQLGQLQARELLADEHNPLTGVQRVAIFAGPAGSASSLEWRRKLMNLVSPALEGYDGAILSGGTNVGIPGVVGRAGAGHRHLIGYTPPRRADGELYRNVRETPDSLYSGEPPRPREFSIREPLQMWSDIIAAGISPEQVFVVVFRGGMITTEELLLARALGANVAWLDPEGAETAPLSDALPFGDAGVLELPVDRMTIRAFVNRSELTEERGELRERIARYLHRDYREKQRGRKPPTDPAMAPWDNLLESLKQSNRGASADIPNKLALLGLRLVKSGGRPLSLERSDVDLLAEAEHGRWVIERLSSGWQLGERHVARGVSPDLVPWDELPERTKDWDRESVRNIPPALAEAGYGVEKATQGPN